MQHSKAHSTQQHNTQYITYSLDLPMQAPGTIACKQQVNKYGTNSLFHSHFVPYRVSLCLQRLDAYRQEVRRS